MAGCPRRARQFSSIRREWRGCGCGGVRMVPTLLTCSSSCGLRLMGTGTPRLGAGWSTSQCQTWQTCRGGLRLRTQQALHRATLVATASCLGPVPCAARTAVAAAGHGQGARPLAGRGSRGACRKRVRCTAWTMDPGPFARGRHRGKRRGSRRGNRLDTARRGHQCAAPAAGLVTTLARAWGYSLLPPTSHRRTQARLATPMVPAAAAHRG